MLDILLIKSNERKQKHFQVCFFNRRNLIKIFRDMEELRSQQGIQKSPEVSSRWSSAQPRTIEMKGVGFITRIQKAGPFRSQKHGGTTL